MQNAIVFGRGKFYQSVKTKLHAKYNVIEIWDNKIRLGRKEYLDDLNLYVYNPAEIDKFRKIPVIIMAKKFWEMYKQLLEMGVRESQLLFGVELFPTTWKEKMAFSGKEHLISLNGKLVYQSSNGDVILGSQNEYENHIKICADQKHKEKYPYINIIANMPTTPASRVFGTERGKPVDRYYIESFLNENKIHIHGETLEIAETTYSLKYGEDRIKNAYMLHVEGWGENAIKGNLETGEGIEENRFDSVIITQTLMFLYNIEGTAGNIYKMLKKGGHALVTVSGISQISRYDADNWGSYYSFHEDAVRRMFVPFFGEENVKVKVYGNMKTAISLLYGLCCEDLKESDFNVYDKDYPVIIGAVLEKNS